MKFVDPAAENLTSFSALIYGPPKIGKSVAACSAKGPILYLNAEGPKALRFAREKFGDAKIREVSVTGEQTLWDAVEYLRAPKCDVKTVVVDTVGEVYRVIVEQLSGGAGNKISLPTYGAVGEMIPRFARLVRDLPVNSVFLAHEEAIEEEGEDDDGDPTTTTHYQPLTGGKKLPRKFPGLFDIVARAEAVREKVTAEDGTVTRSGPIRYVGRLAQGSNYVAGERFGCLGSARELDLSEWSDHIAASFAANRKAA